MCVHSGVESRSEFRKTQAFFIFLLAIIWYTFIMIITYHGKQFWKIQQGDLVLAFNPISRDSKFTGKIARFGSNVALTTINHPDYNGVDTVTYGETAPFVVSGPGDYEIGGIFIKGIASEAIIGKKRFINTIYTMTVDDIAICFLGALTNPTLSSQAVEAIDSADLLFVPVGDGIDSLAPKDAYKLAVGLEPKLIIPMDYAEEDLATFLKEAGAEKTEPIEKLTLKKKDLDGKEGEVVVFASKD